jgi:hypothetical protein
VKTAARLVLLSALGACAPDIPNTPPPNVIFVEFDPGAATPVVPTPNDLARDPQSGLVVVPQAPNETAAQREFDVSYLETLAGFPFESTATAMTSGDLDPTSVNTKSVVAFDLGVGAKSFTPVAISPVWDQATRTISVAPPGGEWTRAHQYAIALIGGMNANGLKGAQGQEVVGSETWTLVSSSTSLVTCQDLNATDCRPTVDIIPSTISDPAARLADQTAKAKQLETLRRLYAPLIDAIAATGVTRTDVVMVWTFTIVDQGEVTFDPAHSVIPFPNDILRPNGKVTLPNPKTGQPLTTADCTAPTDQQIALTCGLNTLDGFSTLAPVVSENSSTLGAVQQADIDPASLNPLDVGLLPVATQLPASQQTAASFTPCLNCSATATTPQELEWKLNVPLDEKTTYFAFVTGGVKDTTGKPVIANPIFAMLRLTNPLFDGTHSTVTLLTDAQAAQLEPLRAALKPALDGLAQLNIPRSTVALAFGFTTQSEASILDQLYAYPTQPPLSQSLPDSPTYLVDATAKYQAVATAGSIPFSAVGKVFIGSFLTPLAVTGPGGTLDVKNPQIEPVSFVVYLPATAAPSGGYPVTIFDHGLTRFRNDSIALANTMAQVGRATIAMDLVFNGDRSSCTGSMAATGQTTDDASCADPTTQKCNEDPLIGRCVARSNGTRAACTGATGDLVCAAQNQGRCVQQDQLCEGGDFLRDTQGRPVISGWDLLNLTSFFATRDNFRQHTIDTSQLVRVIKGAGLATLAGTTFDATSIDDVGQNFGGMLGALADAASPDTDRLVFNASGGGLVQILLESPAFATQRTALLAQLAQQGLTPQTPGFDQFLRITQWILDPADPSNVAYRLTHPLAANPARAAFIQFIQGDPVIPNDATLGFIAAANRSGFTLTPPSFGCTSPLACYEFTEAGDSFDATTATPATRAGFLLVPPTGSRGLAITSKAQLQVATFLATGQLP